MQRERSRLAGLAGKLQPAVWAVGAYRVAHHLHSMGVPALPGVLSILARVVTGAEIDYRATIGRRFDLQHGFGVVIGDTAVIGDDCLVLQGVTLGARSREDIVPQERIHPLIGNRVTIYAGAKVIGPVSIGDDAVIGANAVVLSDVPAGALAVGVPARLIDRRRRAGEEQAG